MKKKILKALVILGCAALLVVASVMGTLAYLTSSSAVSNTFTVGDVSLNMTETKVDSDGVPVTPAERTDTNTYRLVPNKTYTKDPTIYVSANSTESFLFVKIRNQIAAIEKEGDTTIAKQMENNGWLMLSSTATGDIWVYAKNDGGYTNGIIGGNVTEQVIPVFSSFTVKENPENLTQYAAAKVTVTAFAIQTTGFIDKYDLDTARIHAWNKITEVFTFENQPIALS